MRGMEHVGAALTTPILLYVEMFSSMTPAEMIPLWVKGENSTEH